MAERVWDQLSQLVAGNDLCWHVLHPLSYVSAVKVRYAYPFVVGQNYPIVLINFLPIFPHFVPFWGEKLGVLFIVVHTPHCLFC